jgi:hypothetical protein
MRTSVLHYVTVITIKLVNSVMKYDPIYYFCFSSDRIGLNGFIGWGGGGMGGV